MAFRKDDQTEQCIYRLQDINSTIATTPSERLSKLGWNELAKKQMINCQQSRGSLMIIGDSIIAGLGRYRYIWEKYFKDYGTINCGIGGDRTENVLWRAGKMVLPKYLVNVVVHCGSNSLNHHSPEEIASGVIQIGITLIKKRPNLKIFISSILPKGLHWSKVRSKIHKTNSYLKVLSGRLPNFSYVDYIHKWTLDNGDLDERYFYSDFIHLVEKGNEIFAKSIKKSLSSSSPSNILPSPSSLSSSSSQSSPLSSKSSPLKTTSTKPKSQHTMAYTLSYHCPYNSSHYDDFFPFTYYASAKNITTSKVFAIIFTLNSTATLTKIIIAIIHPSLSSSSSKASSFSSHCHHPRETDIPVDNCVRDRRMGQMAQLLREGQTQVRCNGEHE